MVTSDEAEAEAALSGRVIAGNDRAVRHGALERAAGVAEKFAIANLDWHGEATVGSSVAQSIANAIRALKS